MCSGQGITFLQRESCALAHDMAARAGVELGPDLVVRAGYSLESGQAAASRLLSQGVTGVVCASDPLALGVVRAVRKSGLRVPADVSVVGFDDSALMNCTDPPLTTVRQPIELMGRAAIDLLVAQVSGTDVVLDELLFEPELVVRGSSCAGTLLVARRCPGHLTHLYSI